MRRHPCGTPDPTGDASDDAESRPRPILAVLRGLGAAASFAVALLALTAMLNPAWAGLAVHAPPPNASSSGFAHDLIG